MKLRLLVTGGTFDKEYDELTGRLFFKDTHVREMLKLGRADLDRELVLKSCLEPGCERVVVTHGTDTMPETARYLAERVTGRTVVLTGAMVPYTFGSSDGLFNLGGALAYAQVLPHGVYVAMNGRCFDGRAVRKNRGTGRFEAVS